MLMPSAFPAILLTFLPPSPGGDFHRLLRRRLTPPASPAPRSLAAAGSPSYSGASSAFGQLDEPGLYRGEKTGRNESIAEYARPPRQRRQPAIWPLVDIVFRDDHPTGCIVQADRLSNTAWDFDADCIPGRRSVSDRQKNDEAGRCRWRAGCDETGGAVLALVESGGCFVCPHVVVTDDEARLRGGQCHLVLLTSGDRRAPRARAPSPPGALLRQRRR